MTAAIMGSLEGRIVYCVISNFTVNSPYTDGFTLLQGDGSFYFGAVVGRVANRIAKGVFNLEGRQYKLATNNGPNALHGGKRGFDKVIWQGARISHPEGDALRLTYTSKDGEEVCLLDSSNILSAKKCS